MMGTSVWSWPCPFRPLSTGSWVVCIPPSRTYPTCQTCRNCQEKLRIPKLWTNVGNYSSSFLPILSWMLSSMWLQWMIQVNSELWILQNNYKVVWAELAVNCICFHDCCRSAWEYSKNVSGESQVFGWSSQCRYYFNYYVSLFSTV